ncbi:MAG: T9SS type A sorting domain-containing protein [Bacteroidetes bacterium]|nr:T9SS type A sorting domain-containing protein [Bacteroidota bacterium]
MGSSRRYDGEFEMRKIIFLYLCVLFSPLFWRGAGGEAFSQSFYVDGATGSNTNSGTSTAQAWKTIQKAFTSATPGSTVYIRGGTYYENVIANVSGTPANPITFRNYQTEVVVLDGTGTSQNDMLYIEDKSNLIVENITVQNKVVNYATGVTISATASGGVSNITLRNLKITSINWTSNPSATPTSNDNSNPMIVYGQGTNQANAITNVVIDSCEVYNNITGFSEAVALDGNVDTFTVSNNSVHDNKNIGIDMEGNYGTSSNAALDQARNGNCFQNICYNNVSNYATSGGIYVDGGKNTIIERNTSYGNGWGIEIGCEQNGSTSNITVRDNVFYNNKEAGLAIGGYTSSTTGQVLNSSVLNNTFLKDDYSNSGTGEIYMTKMSNCKIQNNIFYTNAQNILISKDNITPFSGNSINYNCWYTPNNNSNNITVNWGTNSYSAFSNYVSQTGMDANSIYADPSLINSNIASPDFHLDINTSPCIDNGDFLFVAGVNETDYFGGVRVLNNHVDIGAHETMFFMPVNEIETETGISIYPNPSSGKFILSTELTKGEVTIYNMQGEKIYSSQINSTKTEITLSNQPQGIYFIQLKTAQGTANKKIVISK